MPETYVEAIHRLGTLLKVKKTCVIFDAAHEPSAHFAYFLEKGVCALTGIMREGEEKTFLYFKPRRMIGFTQLMAQNYADPNYYAEVSIIAKTDCTLYRLPEEAFQDLLARHPDFTKFMLDVLAQNYNDMLNRFLQMQEESVMIRLCRFLLTHSERTDSQLILPKHFTYTEISCYLGAHPVTIGRIMAKLKQSGYLAKDNHRIAIEKADSLEQLIRTRRELEY